MSRKKRAIERQKKQNSPQKKAKQAKKTYYKSNEAKQNWSEKKARKDQSRTNKRISQGVSVMCPLKSWETPNSANCKGCTLKCSLQKG